jgi:anti-sigma regulatory factor (Ser/Thr protein kinase)
MNTKQLVINNDVEQISLLAEYIETIAEEAGISPSLVMSLNLALEEAVTNVVLYAYPEGTQGTVQIDASWDNKKLTFVITDSGTAFDPTQKEDADITLSAEDRPIGGLGIFLVKQLMDTVIYERQDGLKNVLTLTKNLEEIR